MKRVNFFIIFIVFSCIFFNGCDTPTSKTQYYYYEIFTISKTNFNSVSLSSTVSFNSIKTYRDQLRLYHIDFLGSGADLSEIELYSLFTQSGFTPTDANNAISATNSNGNNVAWFNHAQNNNLYVVFYIEKL